MGLRLLTLGLALAIDRLVGEPDVIWSRIPHPIVVFGNAISFVEKRWNSADKNGYERRRDGFLAIAGLLFLAGAAGLLLHCLFHKFGIFGLVAEGIFASIFLAQHSLLSHVSDVEIARRAHGVDAARVSVSKIVGRDPNLLDEAGVCRAAIESLAENASDGVVAPVFWFAVLGLPGLLMYKMLNTADSMIGHMNECYRDFGRASAKLDDVANYIPARICGLLFVVATMIVIGTAAARRSLNVMMRDARLHRSPNAGWPEAAMAGALDLVLGGPRAYPGYAVNEPVLNAAGRMNASGDDIKASLNITSTMFSLILSLVLILALFK
jgi:adenosylcobinamide-phosphate synthase